MTFNPWSLIGNRPGTAKPSSSARPARDNGWRSRIDPLTGEVSFIKPDGTTDRPLPSNWVEPEVSHKPWSIAPRTYRR
jgi:hypothetical protein